MSYEDGSLKESARLFWLIKGHLNTTDDTLRSSHNSYFKRLWVAGSNGAPLYEYEDGFEEAWIEYQNNVSHKEKK